MAFDTFTLTALLCLQLFVMALALTLMTHGRRSEALRWGIGGMWVQLLSWLLVLATGALGVLATVASYFAGALTFVMTLRAVELWIGPRPLMRWAWGLPVLIATAVALGQPGDWLQRGVSNLLMAATQCLLVLGLLWPAERKQPGSWRWRRMLAVPMVVLALLTLWRGVLGFGPSELYPSLRGGHPLALAVLVVGNLSTIMAALAFLAGWRGEAESALRELAQTDPLTGLANRRALEERAAALIAHARRHGDPLVALIIDLDHFKAINDQQGHAQGDAALALTGSLLRELQRPGDCIARYGGEEFVALLARSRQEGAAAFDGRLRSALKARSPQALGFALDYSAGWAQLRPGDRHIHDLLQRADAALYRAKAEGRGRLCAEPGHDSAIS